MPGSAPSDHGAAVASALADRSDALAPALAAAAQMAGLTIVTNSQIQHDTDEPGPVGVLWEQLWLSANATPVGASYSLLDVVTLLSVDESGLDPETLATDLLGAFRTALIAGDTTSGPGAFATLVAAEAAHYGGVDVTAEGVTATDVLVSAPTMTLLITVAVSLMLAASEDALNGVDPEARGHSDATDVLADAAAQGTTPEGCPAAGIPTWLRWLFRKASWGLRVGGLEVWVGYWPLLMTWADDTTELAGLRELLSRTNTDRSPGVYLRQGRSHARWAAATISVLNVILALADLAATATMENSPLVRTKSDRDDGQRRWIDLHITAGEPGSGRGRQHADCVLQMLGGFLPAGGSIYVPGTPMGHVRVQVTGGAGFAAGLQTNGFVLLPDPAVALGTVRTDQNGKLRFEVMGRAQTREVDRDAEPVMRKFSVRISAALAADDANALTRIFLGGLDCASQPADCVATVAEILKLFKFHAGEPVFDLRDWEAAFTLRYTARLTGHDEYASTTADETRTSTSDTSLVLTAEVPLNQSASDPTMLEGGAELDYRPESTYRQTGTSEGRNIDSRERCESTQQQEMVGSVPGELSAQLTIEMIDGLYPNPGPLRVQMATPPMERVRQVWTPVSGPCPGSDNVFEESMFLSGFTETRNRDPRDTAVSAWEFPSAGPILARMTLVSETAQGSLTETFEIRY